MPSANRKVLDRIRKLLAVAERSDFEAERNAALAQAQRLIERHNIDRAAIEEPAGEYLAESIYHFRREPPWLPPILALLQRHFFVAVTYTFDWQTGGSKVELFGLPCNVPMARYVYSFLRQEFQDRWRKRCRETGCRRGVNDYYRGLATAVSKKIRDRERALQESNALTRIGRDLQRALAEKHGELPLRESRHKSGDVNQLLAGLVDGQTIEIRRPLAGPHRQPQLKRQS